MTTTVSPHADHPAAGRLLGESPPFLDLLQAVSRAAPLTRPVLVVGERGTGKEGVAARLHYLSERWQGPFLKVNCAALSEDLLEAELFGHEAGAFTGASSRRAGRFERADGGTLFLDELASASVRVQQQLLRVIEYGEFERLGGQQLLQTDVRVIAATNRDLPTEVAAGRFLPDLLDRLAFDVLTLPPLRIRGDDVLLLAEHFGLAMAASLERPLFAGFAPAARRQLLEHSWPGNIRELRNAVERAVYQLDDAQVPVSHIELDPFASPWRPQPPPAAAAHAPSAREQTGPADQTPLPEDLKEAVRKFEQTVLARALREHRFNQKRTARALGLSYDQLRGYLRKYPHLSG